MTMRDNEGQLISVVEWCYLGKGKFQRRDSRLDVLMGMSASRNSAAIPPCLLLS